MAASPFKGALRIDPPIIVTDSVALETFVYLDLERQAPLSVMWADNQNCSLLALNRPTIGQIQLGVYVADTKVKLQSSAVFQLDSGAFYAAINVSADDMAQVFDKTRWYWIILLYADKKLSYFVDQHFIGSISTSAVTGLPNELEIAYVGNSRKLNYPADPFSTFIVRSHQAETNLLRLRTYWAQKWFSCEKLAVPFRHRSPIPAHFDSIIFPNSTFLPPQRSPRSQTLTLVVAKFLETQHCRYRASWQRGSRLNLEMIEKSPCFRPNKNTFISIEPPFELIRGLTPRPSWCFSVQVHFPLNNFENLQVLVSGQNDCHVSAFEYGLGTYKAIWTHKWDPLDERQTLAAVPAQGEVFYARSRKFYPYGINLEAIQPGWREIEIRGWPGGTALTLDTFLAGFSQPLDLEPVVCLGNSPDGELPWGGPIRAATFSA